MNTPVYLTDVVQSEMDDLCPRKTWQSKFEGGFGIVRRDTLIATQMLEKTHEDLRLLTNLIDISPTNLQRMVDSALKDLTLEDFKDQQKMELLYRRLGWFVAYGLYVEPEVRRVYKNIEVASELVLDHDPLWVVTKPDRLLRHKDTNEVLYWEFVPMPPGLTNRKWLQQWLYNIRLHVGMASVEDHLKNVAITYGQVVGMAEGYYSTLDNRLIHPYVWAYRSREEKGKWAMSYKPNDTQWELAPIWQYTGGLVSWVMACGSQTATNQFQLSPLTMLDNHLVDVWCSHRLHRERAIGTMKEVCGKNQHLRGIHFPQMTNQCHPAAGPVCPYLASCWDAPLIVNPFYNGIYAPNVVPATVVAEVVS